jgi:UDP-3-O-[3-hydroxymyristoyl] glucosamine N-acyltransferase
MKTITKIKFSLEQLKSRYEIGRNFPSIDSVSSLSYPKNNSLIFCIEYKKQYEELLSLVNNSVILVNKGAKIAPNISDKNLIIYVTNPRMEYVYILNNCVEGDRASYPSDSYYVDPGAIVDSTCIIEPYVFIAKDVQMGRYCHIKSGVKIYSNVILGDNCVVGCNTVIGDIGFGIERINNEKWERIPLSGRPMKMPHFGGVRIGSNVEIGALNTIVSGAIDPTTIAGNVKTDDHVHIAHNCKIEDDVLIAAAAELSGGVTIGSNTWIGPNSSIFQQTKIGRRCIVGIGANIFKDMKDGEVYMGAPARKIKKNNE